MARPQPDAPPSPDSPFPSRDDLRDLTEKEGLPESLVDAPIADVAEWTLEGPFPERIGEIPVAAPSPFEQVLLDATASRAGLVVVSEAMRCSAREYARFIAAHNAAPPPALRRFILGRCGATGRDPRFGTFTAGVPPDATEERVVEVWGDGIRQAIRQYLGAGPRAAGIAFVQREGQGLALVLSAARSVHLEPVSAIPGKDGSLHLQGELLQPARQLGAQVNRGSLGFAACTPEEGVLPPRFSLRCPVDRDDETAWIAVSARPPGRLLSNGALLALARPSGGEARTWRRPSYGTPLTVTDAGHFNNRLVAELNRLRRSQGMGALAFESQESMTAAKLAPFYFAAALGMVEASYGDMVALGLMAGWEVGGVIRTAAMGGMVALETRDLDRWLGEALEQPGLRSVLLDPDRTKVAVGAVVPEEDAYLAAVVASYTLFGNEDPVELREDLYAHLNREFDRRDLRFPRRDRDVETAAARHVGRIQAGAATPQEAINDLMNEALVLFRGPVRGWVLHGSSPEDLALPDDLLQGDLARIGAAVGHYQPDDWPWGRQVVLLVAAPESPVRTARASGAGR